MGQTFQLFISYIFLKTQFLFRYVLNLVFLPIK